MRSLSCFIQLDLLAKSGSIHRLYCRNSHFINKNKYGCIRKAWLVSVVVNVTRRSAY